MAKIPLVKAAIAGDETAFEALIKNESDKLYRTAYLYAHNKEDALDILQETICKTFISIHQLKNPEVFSSWVTRILIRTAYEFLKKKKKLVLTGDVFLNNVSELHSQPIDQQIELAEAIEKLNPDYQTVIILFYYHDLSIKGIAEMMEKPEGTIKTYLYRAKGELKKVLEGRIHHGKTVVYTANGDY